ncbi:MAG: adenosylhomocysteinase, partial [Candidatus Omnitrophica bacterium]|nr:adenosylhomocysteinase [Candidatus Omnitrophota bacterium]
ETAVLMEVLKAGGASLWLCASNPLSTQDDVASSLVKDLKIAVYSIKGEDTKTYYRHIRAVLAIKPDVTMDDGADLVSTIHQRALSIHRNIIGGTEETTTGVVRLRALANQGKLRYPIIAVNDASTKHLFDNRYGTGQSTIDGIIRATNKLLAGTHFVVCGYGWCLPKDTKIFTCSGIKSIKDIKIGDTVVGFNGYGKVVNKFHKGAKELYEVKTKDGYNIRATKEHEVLVFTQDGFRYKKVENLLPGDNLVVCKNENGWGKNDYSDLIRKYSFSFKSEDLFYILGCLIGDGTVTKKRSVSLACSLRDKVHFKNALSKLEFHIGDCRSNLYLDIYSIKFRNLLVELGLYYLKSFQKIIPESVFSAKEKIISSFLRGLFDTDGWVIKKRGKRIFVVGLSSSSKKLIEEVQILLMNYGIHSHIIERKSRVANISGRSYATKSGYELVIKGLESRKIFKKKIGFSLKRKQRELSGLENIGKIDKYDSIPYFKEIIRKINKKYKIVVSREDAKVININGKKRISKEITERILDYKYSKLNDRLLDELRTIINNDYKLIPLERVRKLKEKEEVYDIEVSDINSFVANGILVHNCGKGVALRAKGMASRVIIVEVDPLRALEATMDGYEVMPIKEASEIGDIFVTTTGDTSVIRREHFAAMKDGAIVANSGHFNVEIDIPALEKLSKAKKRIREFTDEYILKDGRKIYLLGEGRLINLAAAEGHPAQVMDMSFANQALSVEYIVENHRRLRKDVYGVPEEIDKNIARLKLKSLGIKIDTLTSQQKKYLSSWELGT